MRILENLRILFDFGKKEFLSQKEKERFIFFDIKYYRFDTETKKDRLKIYFIYNKQRMKITIKTFPELRKAKWITKKMMKDAWVSSQTYLNMIEWKNKPTETTISKFCNLFEITRKEFDRLLTNTVLKEQ